jgi:hypothetical protein
LNGRSSSSGSRPTSRPAVTRSDFAAPGCTRCHGLQQSTSRRCRDGSPGRSRTRPPDGLSRQEGRTRHRRAAAPGALRPRARFGPAPGATRHRERGSRLGRRAVGAYHDGRPARSALARRLVSYGISWVIAFLRSSQDALDRRGHALDQRGYERIPGAGCTMGWRCRAGPATARPGEMAAVSSCGRPVAWAGLDLMVAAVAEQLRIIVMSDDADEDTTSAFTGARALRVLNVATSPDSARSHSPGTVPETSLTHPRGFLNPEVTGRELGRNGARL